MEFQSQFIQIGNVQIRYYGIIIVTAMLIATVVAARLAKRSGKDPEHVYGALTWAIIPGIIFARLWFVLFPPINFTQGCGSADPGAICRNTAWFFQNFFDLQEGAIAIWSGGLSIFGALLGGLLGAYIYLRRNRLPVGQWLDIAAVVLPLGQAIGRWANFINQELYGTPVPEFLRNLNFGLVIPVENRPEPYGALEYYDARFHPLFLYESLWNFAAFVVLYSLYTRNRSRFRAGDFFLIYIAQYAFVRFLLEFLRIEVTLVNIGGNNVNLSQLVCVLLFVFAVGTLLYRHRPGVEASYESDAAAAVEAPLVTPSVSVARENATSENA
jgi:phosphatidylglycerol---prolipoprotein diacylglyceryl transferase